MAQGWRDTSEYRQVWEMVSDIMLDRWDKGQEAYGNEFSGLPLQHLEEELYDALFYTIFALRQTREMEDLLRECRDYMQTPPEFVTPQGKRALVQLRNKVDGFLLNLAKKPHKPYQHRPDLDPVEAMERQERKARMIRAYKRGKEVTGRARRWRRGLIPGTGQEVEGLWPGRENHSPYNDTAEFLAST